MAHADRKHFGPAHQGKGDGTGAMTEADPETIPANAVLSNRDIAAHAEGRGLDSARVRSDQRQDHVAGRVPHDPPAEEDEP